MKIAFLFPGQGSQSIGMGKDLYDKFEEYRQVCEKVKNITKIDVEKLTFEGTEDILSETKNTQIAVLTMSLAILEILKKYVEQKHKDGITCSNAWRIYAKLCTTRKLANGSCFRC